MEKTVTTQDEINNFVIAAHRDFETVRSMVEANPALLNSNASWQETAIQAATQTRQIQIVEYLLAAGAPMDIFTAAMLGLQDRVEQFLEEEAGLVSTPGVHGYPILYFPVISGHQEIAELFLAKGADPNAGEGGTTPLHGAVQFGREDMVEWLLKNDARPEPKNYEGKTQLELATESGNETIIKMLTAALNQE